MYSPTRSCASRSCRRSSFSLRRADKHATGATAAPRIRVPALERGLRPKVLLVDKDHRVRGIIKRCLSDACEIVDFCDGAHGARWLRSECVDLAIVDVN